MKLLSVLLLSNLVYSGSVIRAAECSPSTTVDELPNESRRVAATASQVAQHASMLAASISTSGVIAEEDVISILHAVKMTENTKHFIQDLLAHFTPNLHEQSNMLAVATIINAILQTPSEARDLTSERAIITSRAAYIGEQICLEEWSIITKDGGFSFKIAKKASLSFSDPYHTPRDYRASGVNEGWDAIQTLGDTLTSAHSYQKTGLPNAQAILSGETPTTLDAGSVENLQITAQECAMLRLAVTTILAPEYYPEIPKLYGGKGLPSSEENLTIDGFLRRLSSPSYFLRQTL